MAQVNHVKLKRCISPIHEGPNPIPLSEFSRSTNGNRDGVRTWCRACRAKAGREQRRQRRADNPGRFKPCLVCGQETNASVGVCQRTPACRREYHRRRNQLHPEQQREATRRYLQKKAKPDRSRKAAKEATAPRPVHPCSLCGQMTRSVFPVCTGPACINEYRRLERAARKAVSFVYGVWFPAPQVLKVGFTGLVTSEFVSHARTRAIRRGWDVQGISAIWKQPGDVRTEAWMQATLAFRWLRAFEQKQNRLCEWFAVPGLTGDEITAVLDGVYCNVPSDLAKDAA